MLSPSSGRRVHDRTPFVLRWTDRLFIVSIPQFAAISFLNSLSRYVPGNKMTNQPKTFEIMHINTKIRLSGNNKQRYQICTHLLFHNSIYIVCYFGVVIVCMQAVYVLCTYALIQCISL
jgi:hypothetical protein